MGNIIYGAFGAMVWIGFISWTMEEIRRYEVVLISARIILNDYKPSALHEKETMSIKYNIYSPFPFLNALFFFSTG